MWVEASLNSDWETSCSRLSRPDVVRSAHWHVLEPLVRILKVASLFIIEAKLSGVLLGSWNVAGM